MAQAFKCDRCGVLYEKRQNPNPKLYVGKSDQLFAFRAYDLCCTCQARLEVWWSEGLNDVDKEDIVVDPSKKCCYNCKHAEIDNYNNSRCTNPESISYNIHMAAERYYCKEFERKESNNE